MTEIDSYQLCNRPKFNTLSLCEICHEFWFFLAFYHPDGECFSKYIQKRSIEKYCKPMLFFGGGRGGPITADFYQPFIPTKWLTWYALITGAYLLQENYRKSEMLFLVVHSRQRGWGTILQRIEWNLPEEEQATKSKMHKHSTKDKAIMHPLFSTL